MSARNFPPSFWNSNYVHPTPAPTHPQVSYFINLWETNCFILFFFPFLIFLRWRIYMELMVVIQQIHGYLTQLTMDHMHMQPMLMPPMPTHIITIWRNTDLSLGYRNNTVTVQGNFLFASKKSKRRWLNFIFHRLHHEQQAAHALESAAAYSSYPTMAGKINIWRWWLWNSQ